MIARVVPEKKNDEDRGEVNAGDGGGDAGTDYTEHGEAPVAEDQEIVAKEVDEIGGDEGKRDGTDEVHALEGAAKGEVEEKWYESEGQGVHVGAGEDGDIRGDAEVIEEIREKPNGGEKHGSQGKAEIDAVHKRVEAVVAAAGAERLRDEGVEADKDAFSEECEHQEEAGADADGGDGLGAVGETSDKHSVFNGHADPANFGQDERDGQVQGGAKLGAKGGPGEHERIGQFTGEKVTR